MLELVFQLFLLFYVIDYENKFHIDAIFFTVECGQMGENHRRIIGPAFFKLSPRMTVSAVVDSRTRSTKSAIFILGVKKFFDETKNIVRHGSFAEGIHSSLEIQDFSTRIAGTATIFSAKKCPDFL